MLRRAWKPVLGAAALAVPTSYLYFWHTANKRKPTFSIDVREKGPDGKTHMVKRSFPLLPKPAVEQRINEFAASASLPPSQGFVWKHTTAHLSSNDPIEDAHAQAVITTQATSSDPARSLLFYSVMDGHSGFHTSRLLSQVLIPAVVLELSSLARDGDVSAKMSSILDVLKYPFSRGSLPHAGVSQEGHIERVSQAIQRAFDNVDFEIVNGPLRVLAANVGKLDKEKIPDLSQHPMAEASMLPALSGVPHILPIPVPLWSSDFVLGSCALMALLDPLRRDLYVACTGDSRAVAGIWEENEDGTGAWRVEVLSEDQTGRNENEAKRYVQDRAYTHSPLLTSTLSSIRSEHPASEAEDVISRGRILGGLEPSRAFGDARYKWPLEVQET
jgi:pyruvate dehydrogenase phosphatase